MTVQFGSGALKFQLVNGWQRRPEGWPLEDIAGVCTDANDNVFLYARGEHPVSIYSKDGKFLHSWGPGQFSPRSHGIFMSGDDEVFLARVVVEDCLASNTGSARDVVVGRLFEPAGYEQFGGRVQQALASLSLALLATAPGMPGFSGRLPEIYDDVLCRYLTGAGRAIAVHRSATPCISIGRPAPPWRSLGLGHLCFPHRLRWSLVHILMPTKRCRLGSPYPCGTRWPDERA